MGSLLLNVVNNLSKEFMKLNLNSDMMIKNLKFAKLNISVTTFFLNLVEYKCFCCKKIINTSSMKN